MIYIDKTSHLLQHNSRKTPNTQFNVGKLTQLEGSKHNLDSQPGQGKATQSHVYSQPRRTSERLRVLAH